MIKSRSTHLERARVSRQRLAGGAEWPSMQPARRRRPARCIPTQPPRECPCLFSSQRTHRGLFACKINAAGDYRVRHNGRDLNAA